MPYQDKDNRLSDSVFDAAVAAGQQQKPTYAGTFDQQLKDLYDQISGRPKFEYDVNADPLYQQYKDQYIQQGKLAMRDTMGKAASLTGGYGSTYGQAVGQQTYDAYLKDLSAVIPELYGTAYDQYKDDGDRLLTMYGLVGDQRDTEYSRYRDEMGDWTKDREYQRQVENEEYNRRIAEEQTAYNRQKDEYSRQQQAYTNLVAMIKASGYMPTDAELQAAGMTREAAQAIASEFQRGVDLENRNQALKEWQIGMQVFGNGGSSGGGGGGGRSSGGGGGGGYYDAGYDEYGGVPSGYTIADIVAGNSDAIAAAAAGYQIANTSGNAASEQEIVDAIDFATGRAKAGSYAYKPNKNARNY